MHRLLIGTAIAASLIVAGCDQKPDKDKSADHVRIDQHAGKVTIQTDNGEAKFEMATNGESLKAELPSFVPAYPNGKIQSTMAGPSGGGQGGGIVFTTPDAPDAVIAYYKQKAKAAGMEETMNMQTAETLIFAATNKSTKNSLHVSAIKGDDGSQVSLFWSNSD